MATGEDETQPVVFHRFIVRRLVGPLFGALGEFRHRGVKSIALSLGVDGAKAAGGNKPRRRVFGNPGLRPPFDGGGEGVVHRFLGAVEIAEQPNERRKDLSRIATIDGVERIADLGDCRFRHPTPYGETTVSRIGLDRGVLSIVGLLDPRRMKPTGECKLHPFHHSWRRCRLVSSFHSVRRPFCRKCRLCVG
jgi:hypothetical protein